MVTSSLAIDHPSLLQRFYAFDQTLYELIVHEPDALPRHVPEAFVHDLWAGRHTPRRALTTASGEPIVVLHPGTLNTDGGPDFRDARLRIGGTEWVGDVEIHVTSGGWFDHHHHLDPHYNSVILHVTLFPDIWTGGLLRADDVPIPEVILYPHLQASLRTLLHTFHTAQPAALPCASIWSSVPASTRHEWIERLGRERVLEKAEAILAAAPGALALETALHREIFGALGYAKNSEPMRDLAARAPLALARTYEDVRDLEALHAGTAGLLPTPADLHDADRATADYVMDLRDRYQRMVCTHDLVPLPGLTWQFFRLRPANFPPLRVAQAAALTAPGGLLRSHPLRRLRAALAADAPLTALRHLFQIAPDPFWELHLRYERSTRPRSASIGRTRTDVILANAVVPVLLADALRREDTGAARAAVEILMRLPPQHDHITRSFEALGEPNRDGLTSQGLHQLRRTRCRNARCLTCPIGRALLDRRDDRST